MIVLGSGHRAAQGIKRGYVTDMAAATYAVRDAVERAEKIAGTSVASVWIGCSGAGLASRVAQVEIDIGGRRIEEDDIEHLLVAARDSDPARRAHGAPRPAGALHARRRARRRQPARASMPSGSGVDIHVMLADGAPMRNLTEAVQNAHLEVEAVVASPIAAGHACLTPEERDLGVALVEFGARGDQRRGLRRRHAARPDRDPVRLGRHHRRDRLAPSASAASRPSG